MSDELILVQDLIHEIRGKKVMLDFDLAKLYQIETRALKQAVRRNLERFPDDFMFVLTQEEHKSLKLNMRSQFVTSNEGISDYTRYAPFAFTEQGVAMLSSVLKSNVAIAANIAIMRAFVRVREYLLTTSTLSAELLHHNLIYEEPFAGALSFEAYIAGPGVQGNTIQNVGNDRVFHFIQCMASQCEILSIY